jgi:hypothetical protein
MRWVSCTYSSLTSSGLSDIMRAFQQSPARLVHEPPTTRPVAHRSELRQVVHDVYR